MKERRVLTPREMEVMELASQGKTKDEIATCLGISFDTVKSHMTSVRVKLNVTNTAQAVRVAITRGLFAV